MFKRHIRCAVSDRLISLEHQSRGAHNLPLTDFIETCQSQPVSSPSAVMRSLQRGTGDGGRQTRDFVIHLRMNRDETGGPEGLSDAFASLWDTLSSLVRFRRDVLPLCDRWNAMPFPRISTSRDENSQKTNEQKTSERDAPFVRLLVDLGIPTAKWWHTCASRCLNRKQHSNDFNCSLEISPADQQRSIRHSSAPTWAVSAEIRLRRGIELSDRYAERCSR
jgi:hypothetical protein